MGNRTPRGLDCKAYYNTGTYGTPVWVEIVKTIDVDLPLDKDTNEIADRSSEWKKSVGLHKTAGLSLKYNKRTGPDTVFAALIASYYSNTTVDMLILDGPVATAGSNGVRLPALAKSLKKGQPINGVQEHTFEFVTADDDNDPVAFTAP